MNFLQDLIWSQQLRSTVVSCAATFSLNQVKNISIWSQTWLKIL